MRKSLFVTFTSFKVISDSEINYKVVLKSAVSQKSSSVIQIMNTYFTYLSHDKSDVLCTFNKKCQEAILQIIENNRLEYLA